MICPKSLPKVVLGSGRPPGIFFRPSLGDPMNLEPDQTSGNGWYGHRCLSQNMVNSNVYNNNNYYYYHIYIYVIIYIYSNFTMCGCFFHEASTTGSFSTMPRKRWCQDMPSVSRAQQRRLQTRTMYSMVTRKNKASSGDLKLLSYWCSSGTPWFEKWGSWKFYSDWDTTITKYGDVLRIKQMIPSGNLLQSSGKSPSVVGKS